jgi:hypothetical protein
VPIFSYLIQLLPLAFINDYILSLIDRFDLLVLLLFATDPFSYCFCSLFLASISRESDVLTSASFAMCVSECALTLVLAMIPQQPENVHCTYSSFNSSNFIPLNLICKAEFVALQWGMSLGFLPIIKRTFKLIDGPGA